MEKVDTVSKNVSNVKVKGSPIRARVLTIDTGTHRLIHPSASTLQPAPAFFFGFCAFLRPTDVFPTRVGMVRFFRRWGAAPLKRGSFVFIGVHSWSLPAIKPQK